MNFKPTYGIWDAGEFKNIFSKEKCSLYAIKYSNISKCHYFIKNLDD